MENTAERQLMGTFKELLKDSKELKELKALIKKPKLSAEMAEAISQYEANHLDGYTSVAALLAMIINNEILHPDLSELDSKVIEDFVCEGDSLDILIIAVIYGYEVEEG